MIQGTRSICIRRPAKERKSFHKTRIPSGNFSLAVHRVLIRDSITCATVVIIMNMPIGVCRHELDSAVRVCTVNVNTCPTIAVDDTTSAYNGHIRTTYHHTPAGDIRALVVFVIFGAGKHRSFDGQSGVFCRDMPHLLAGPGLVIITRTQLDITAGIGTQEITTRLELHTEVLFARLRRIHHHLTVRTSWSRKTQIVNRQSLYLLELRVKRVTSVRMAILVLISHVVIRTIGYRNKHIIAYIVLGLPKTLHADQTVDGINLAPSGVIIFVPCIVAYIILLVVGKEIRIRASRSNRFVQDIETEDNTLGGFVLVIRKRIHRLTGFGGFGVAAVLVIRQSSIETNHRSIGICHRVTVAPRYIQPIHFAVRHT